MTCIVGVNEGGRLYLGGDSARIRGWRHAQPAHAKVFRHPRGFLVGCSGKTRISQIIRYAFDPPAPGRGVDDHEYLCTTFVNALRGTLKEEGIKLSDDDNHFSFLLGFRRQLYVVHTDLCVTFGADGYAACGCGEDLAVGALAATEGLMSPIERLETALQVAEKHNIGVRAPYAFVEGSGAWRRPATVGRRQLRAARKAEQEAA